MGNLHHAAGRYHHVEIGEAVDVDGGSQWLFPCPAKLVVVANHFAHSVIVGERAIGEAHLGAHPVECLGDAWCDGYMSIEHVGLHAEEALAPHANLLGIAPSLEEGPRATRPRLPRAAPGVGIFGKAANCAFVEGLPVHVVE